MGNAAHLVGCTGARICVRLKQGYEVLDLIVTRLVLRGRSRPIQLQR